MSPRQRRTLQDHVDELGADLAVAAAAARLGAARDRALGREPNGRDHCDECKALADHSGMDDAGRDRLAWWHSDHPDWRVSRAEEDLIARYVAEDDGL